VPDPTRVTGVESVNRGLPLGTNSLPEPLPSTLEVTFGDDHVENVPVTWAAYDLSGMTRIGQTLTVAGHLDDAASTAVVAVITVTNPYADCTNLLVNGSFEKASFDGWTVAGTGSSASPLFTTEAGSVYDGTYALNSWSGAPTDYTLTQTVAVTPGMYVMWGAAQGAPVSGADVLQFTASSGAQVLGTGTFTGLGTWKAWSVPLVPLFVQDDAVTFTVSVQMAANDWATFDDFALCRTGDVPVAPTQPGEPGESPEPSQPSEPFTPAPQVPTGGAGAETGGFVPNAPVGAVVLAVLLALSGTFVTLKRLQIRTAR